LSPAADATGRHIITGGSGFVGRHLAAALVARNKKVVIFDLSEPHSGPGGADYIRGDIRIAEDLAALQLSPADTVYHLAARQFHLATPNRHRDSWFSDVNVLGTRRLLDAAQKKGVAGLIYFSTDMTYGRPRPGLLTPDHPQNPIGPYGESKLAAERLIRAAGKSASLKATIFRPRLIAGAGRLGILKKLFMLIHRNLPVPLIGSGRNRYQMVAVEDCVAAALASVEHGFPAGPFNLGSAAPPTVRDLLSMLISRAGSRSKLLPIPAGLLRVPLALCDRLGIPLLYPEQYEIADLDCVLDISETEAALNWRPTRRDEDILYDAYWNFVSSIEIRNPSPAK
jgi:dTDP-glucose 4,6-dehydratase